MQIRPLTFTAAMITLGTAALLAQSAQTFMGSVTDSMCGAHHMMKNATAAECTRKCVKAGSEFSLATGNKVYTLKGDKAQLDKLAGENVTVKGKAVGNTIMVESIAPSK